uniref:Hydrolase_4 domain-containing protein n=1 Tax=Parastrongyloides trichosuri TaxID=131310 RepID=A0A0N4ZFM4_PARTI
MTSFSEDIKFIESKCEVNFIEDINMRIRYKTGKIRSHIKEMISLNPKKDIKNMKSKGSSNQVNDDDIPTLVIVVEDNEQDDFILPLNCKSKLVKEYKFLQKDKATESAVQLVEDNTKKKPSDFISQYHLKYKNKCFEKVISFVEDVKYYTKVCFTFLYVITPPTRASIVRKAAFHPPTKLKNYFLTNNSEHNNLVFKSAEEAHGHRNVVLCLPSIIEQRHIAVYLFQQILRTRVKIIENRLKTKIVTLLCRCVHSCKTNRKSPYLLIFSQPNSSDIGSGMLTDPNFVDIADYLNLDVLVYDYGGFGLSQSKPGEEELFADIDAVFEYACNGLKYQPKNIVLFGFSMGTAVSVYLASKINDLAGVVLLAPFTSLIRVLFQKPKEEKTSRIDQFVTVDRIDKVKAKTLIIHGTNDSMVSIKHSMILYSKLSDPATPLWLQGGTHQSVYCEKATWRRIKTFCKHELGLKEKWKEAVMLKKRRRTITSLTTKNTINSILERSSSSPIERVSSPSKSPSLLTPPLSKKSL